MRQRNRSVTDRRQNKRLCYSFSPQVWWTDDAHRKTYCCRNPTSFPSYSGHSCRMNRLSPTPNLCVCLSVSCRSANQIIPPSRVLVPYIYVPLFSLSARCCALPQSSHAALRRTFPWVFLLPGTAQTSLRRLAPVPPEFDALFVGARTWDTLTSVSLPLP
jgi:hypothetical protein